jgi:hypothetical protein
MLIMMTSYSQSCQPRNPCNDIAWKITCFLTKYGDYIINKYIFGKVRYRNIMSNFLMILAIFFFQLVITSVTPLVGGQTIEAKSPRQWALP